MSISCLDYCRSAVSCLIFLLPLLVLTLQPSLSLSLTHTHTHTHTHTYSIHHTRAHTHTPFTTQKPKSSLLNTNPTSSCHCSLFFFKILCIFRERGREGERGRGTSMYSCLLHTPYWGPGLQPRHVPRQGIEPVTLWFAGPRSIH